MLLLPGRPQGRVPRASGTLVLGEGAGWALAAPVLQRVVWQGLLQEGLVQEGLLQEGLLQEVLLRQGLVRQELWPG